MKKTSSKTKKATNSAVAAKKSGKPVMGRIPVSMKAPHSVRVNPSKAVTSKVVRNVTINSLGGQQELTKAQIRELETRLRGLHAELALAVTQKTEIVTSAATSESLIKGDDAEVAEKQRVSNALLQELDILKHRMSLIHRALTKIREGSYGFCEETEEPIGYERLLVVPWARYCVQVQEVREKKLRDFRVSKLRSEV